jgi:Transposase DDE domain./Transposase domain (DUF772).
LIEDVSLFTSQSAASFYDKLFLTLDYELPKAKTGRKGFRKEAMLNAYIVSACEGFGYISDLRDYLDNNRLIAHYCGFDITKTLPSYWTFDRFLKRIKNGDLKEIMASQVRKLYELGIVDASFIGLDSTPIMANTSQNNPKSFAKNKFSPENHPKCDPDCALGVHSASNQQNEKNYEFYWGYKNHILVDCISGLPLYELTTAANIADSTVVESVLEKANGILPLAECTFIGDKGYDAKHVYNTVKDIYNGEAVIPLNTRNTKSPEKLPSGNPLCEAGLAMSKDGKTKDNGRTRQKFCCPFRQSKTGQCPCNHKNWNNGKKNRGCTKYFTVPDDYRLSIDRDCLYFKRIYALRTECERYNSRFKASGRERLWIRNGASAANLNTIAHIAALAIALAAVSSNSNLSYRSRKALRRAG